MIEKCPTCGKETFYKHTDGRTICYNRFCSDFDIDKTRPVDVIKDLLGKEPAGTNMDRVKDHLATLKSKFPESAKMQEMQEKMRTFKGSFQADAGDTLVDIAEVLSDLKITTEITDLNGAKDLKVRILDKEGNLLSGFGIDSNKSQLPRNDIGYDYLAGVLKEAFLVVIRKGMSDDTKHGV